MIHKDNGVLLRVTLALYSSDVTRRRLARAFGLDPRQPILLQHHKIPPTEKTVRRIATMAGVSSGWLINGHPEKPQDYILDKYIMRATASISGSSVLNSPTAESIVVNVRNE